MVATILMHSNLFYYYLSGYFSPQAFEVPLLHTWSLAVEDQFYITWPAILMLIMPRLSHASVPVIVTGILPLSLTNAVKTTGADPEWAFFMLPSRAWELLLGCLLGLLYTVPARVWSPIFAEIAGYSGLVVSCCRSTFIYQVLIDDCRAHPACRQAFRKGGLGTLSNARRPLCHVRAS